jgi:hypothetical protein
MMIIRQRSRPAQFALIAALAALMMLALTACGTAGEGGATTAPTATVPAATGGSTGSGATDAPTATTGPDDMATMPMEEATPADGTGSTDTAEATPTQAADSGAGTGGAGGVTEISAVLREWAIDMSTAEAPAGTIRFTVTNEGRMQHNLAVQGAGGTIAKTATFAGSEGAQTLEVQLEPGTYTIICDLPGHAQQGQRTTLVVK